MARPSPETSSPAGPGPPGDLPAAAVGHLVSCAQDPGGWAQVLTAAAANLRLGFTNAVLADAQRPGAGPVASPADWRDAGWQVRENEHARIWILDGPRPVKVFFRAQVRPARTGTEPPLPGRLAVTGGDPDRAVGVLTTFARLQGYEVTRPQGAWPHIDEQRRIAIPAGLPPGPAAAALAHQLSHVVAQASRRPDPLSLNGRDTCNGTLAVEADSVAWVVLSRLGVDPAAAGVTFPAARLWAGPDPRSPLGELLTAAGGRIVRTAVQIAGHAEKLLAELPAPPPPASTVVSGTALPAGPAPPARRAILDQVTGRPGWPYPDQALVRVNAAAASYFRNCLPGSWAEGYLSGRGFGPSSCREWQLGYAPPGWTGLLEHLRRGGYPDELIESAGLARRSSRGTLYDVFRDRVMIPIRGPHGQVIAFAGRAADGAAAGTPKYLNTQETAVFHKDHVLYGLAEGGAALNGGARPVLVEGYLDVIAVTVSGGSRFAGAAPGGTALSVHQMAALATVCDLERAPLLVARDPDAAGQKATIRDYELIVSCSPAAGAAVLPEGRDPADIFARSGPGGLLAALTAEEYPAAVDAVLSQFDGKLQWAEGQLNAVRATAALLAKAPPADPVAAIARVAQKTGLPHADVALEFAAAFAAARPLPKEPGPAGPGSDDRRPGGATRDFPAAPIPGRPHRVTRRPAGRAPRSPGSRPPPGHRR